MKKELMILFFLFLLLINVSIIMACTCAPEDSPQEAFERFDVIFSGKMLEYEFLPDRIPWYDLNVTFKVYRMWKGPSDVKQISLRTATSGAACGKVLYVGEEYLVYALSKNFSDARTNIPDTFWWVHLCSRTRPLDEAQEDIEFLRGKTTENTTIEAETEDVVRPTTETGTEIETEDYKKIIKVKNMTAAQVMETFRDQNRLRLNQSELPETCNQIGSVIKCNISGGRVMAVMAGESGNTIIRVQGVNMTTEIELYHHNGRVYGISEDNESKVLNYFPDQLRERIRERIQARLADDNETIELNEEGEYEVEIKKRARFLGVFKVKEKVRFHIDPETGEILNERAPWWGFLANDEEE
jgi:hypothetical protein